jgi:phosphatidylinositol alpha-1,6-mannosyltransferase
MTGAPALAAISLESTGGGVAAVARLLWDVCNSQWDRAQLLKLIQGTHPQPTLADKVRYALRLAAVQATGRADWILYSHLGLAKPLRGIPRGMQKPYVVFLHGIEAWCGLPPAHLDLLAGATHRIANSTYTATRVMRAHPDIGPVAACPLASPRAVRAAGTRAPASVDIGPHAVLAVGRLSSSERYKGHDELIEEWPLVVSQIPDAVLVIAGTGDDAPRLQEKAGRSGVATSIRFTGYVSDESLDALYRSAAVFALPSRAEGFGLVYLEAMERHLACVASVHDAAGDVIAHERTGLLVDQDTRGELAGALVTLLRDEERRTRMGNAGYARLQADFTVDRFRERLLGVLASSRTTASTAA